MTLDNQPSDAPARAELDVQKEQQDLPLEEQVFTLPPIARYLTLENVAWVILAISAFLTRFWNLGERVMSHDESLHVYYSWLFSKGSLYIHNPMMHGPFLFESTAAFQKLFGTNDATSRIVPALLGMVIVILIPLLLRPWLGKAGALSLAVLLLVSPYVLFYSRYIRHDIIAITFALIAAVAILSYLREHSEGYLMLLATCLALMLSTMEISFFYLAVFVLFLVLRALVRYPWREMLHSAEADLFVVIATLGAFFSSPIALLVLNPIYQRITGQPFVDISVLDAQNMEWAQSMYAPRLWALLAVFAVLATALGLLWGRLRWLKLAAAFGVITTALYTTFYNNWKGLGSGFIGSLGYWLSQHAVNRGTQPWYYYFIVFPLYEYLPIIFGLGTLVYLALRWQKLEPYVRAFAGLMSLWAAGIFVGLTIAGEKMPWLSTHLTIPFIMLSALGLSRLFGSLRSRMDPVSETRSLAFFGGWAALALAGLLLVLTVRTSYMVNYINYDYTTEFVGYAHSAPGVKWLMSDLEKIAAKTGQGHQMIVAYDNGVAWPMAWYLRDYPGFYGDNPNRGSLAGAPIVIASANHWTKVEAMLDADYNRYEVIRMWWPMEGYKNLSWERIRNALKDPQMRKAIWNILWARDYKLYADLTGDPLDPPRRWILEDRMRIYIRKEIAAQIPKLALSDSQIEDITVMPDAYGTLRRQVEPIRLVQPGLTRPRALAFAPDGSVYVADSGASRIVHLNAQGEVIKAWGTKTADQQNPPDVGTFNEPWGVAVGADGSVYVADTWNHRIQKFDAEGNFLLQWGVPGLSTDGPDRFWGPRGLAIGPNGNIYVTDTGNRRVAAFSSSGEHLFDFEQPPDRNLDEPVGLAITPDQQVLVVDTWNMRVVLYDLSGKYLYTFPVQAWNSSTIENKPYTAVDKNGLVYLTDPEGYRVLVFSLDGQAVAAFGDIGEEPGNFGLPNGIAVSPQGEVWVVDAGNNRIAVYPEIQP